jgi:dihydrodipicolinate synthase/N-acetylneuraminate lyase
VRRLQGIVVATVTPMNRSQALDLGVLRELLEFLLQAGIHGVYLLASQGEFFSLTREERRRVARAGVRAVSGRVPVIVNSGAISTDETLRLSREAEAEGADGLGVITPYYLKPSQDELYQHYRAVIRAVRCPVYAYNNPGRAGGVGMDAVTVTRLARMSKRFAGIFDATGSLALAKACIPTQQGAFSYFPAGQLDFARALRLGARGAVLATANVAPREFVALYEAARLGKRGEVNRLRERLEPFDTLFRTGLFPGTMKACLDLTGFPAGPPRCPAIPAPPEVRAKAQRVLKQLQPWRAPRPERRHPAS